MTSGNKQSKPSTKTRQRGINRVKTGCDACRKRRAKCDEVRPVCSRCIRNHDSCIYRLTPALPLASYSYQAKPYLPYEVEFLTAPHQVRDSITWEERFASHAFRTEVAAFIAGAFDASLWTVHLLRAVQQHPVLWYASNAVAAMYKRRECNSETPDSVLVKKKCYDVALVNYNKCIKHLLELGGPEKETTLYEKVVVLVASVLLTALCNLRESRNEAFLHSSNGLQLFQKWNLKQKLIECPNPEMIPFPAQSIISFFSQVDTEMLTLSCNTTEPLWIHRAPPPLPDMTFTTLKEASVSFEAILNGIQGSLASPTGGYLLGPWASIMGPYKRMYVQWVAKFDLFLEDQKSSFDTDDKKRLLTLQMRHEFVGISLRQERAGQDPLIMELFWDQSLADFRRIIKLAQELYKLIIASGNCFTMEPSVCAVLKSVAQRCRDGAVRREAIRLLRAWPVKELIFDPTLAADIAEESMLQEECAVFLQSGDDGCDCIANTYICYLHRVIHTGSHFTEDSGAMVTLTSVADMINQLPGRKLLIKI